MRIPFLKLAWRNLWRNKRRTILTLGAMTFYSWMLLWFLWFWDGAHDGMMDNYVRILTGHVQIHARGFSDDMSVMKRIREPGPIVAAIESTEKVAAYSLRVKTYALAAAHGDSAGAFVLAFDPRRERGVSYMHRLLREGRCLEARNRGEVVLGYVLAENLGLALGDQIALMVQAADGSMGADKFTVVGLADPGISAMNNSLIMMNLADAQELLAYGDAVNEIVVMAEDSYDVARVHGALEEQVDPERYEVLTWAEAAPEMKEMIELDWASFLLIMAIFTAVALLGIMNTVVMSVFERVREFGIMMALGLRPGQLARLVVTETMLMAFVAMAIGFSLAVVTTWLSTEYGFDMEPFGAQESMADWGMANTLFFAKFSLKFFVVAFASVLGMSFLATLYPALRTAAMRPVEAIKFQ
ncbi:MAG: FtsX-like permease family protein [candidate division Zixibacteria bacterium]|nr:FtsX-like permease family protein [candidate division Zixibacteria bacterium]